MAWCYQDMDFELPHCVASHAARRQIVLEGLWSPSKQQSQYVHTDIALKDSLPEEEAGCLS